MFPPKALSINNFNALPFHSTIPTVHHLPRPIPTVAIPETITTRIQVEHHHHFALFAVSTNLPIDTLPIGTLLIAQTATDRTNRETETETVTVSAGTDRGNATTLDIIERTDTIEMTVTAEDITTATTGVATFEYVWTELLLWGVSECGYGLFTVSNVVRFAEDDHLEGSGGIQAGSV